MRRKRWAAMIAVGVSVVMLAAACGSGDKSSSGSNGSSTTGANAGKTPATVPGFDGKTITLGVITPQSGLTGAIAGKYIGKPLTDGNQTYWEMKNAAGGVDGKYKVKLSVGDSQYDATVATQVYASLKPNVLAFQQVLGTEITTALEPQLQSDQMVASPATLDAEWALDANLLPFTTTYQLLAINGINYYWQNGGKGKNICTIGQNDAYGAAGQQGAEYAVEQLKTTLKTTQSVPLLGDKTAAVQALKGAKCDAVVTTLLFADMASLIKTLNQNQFTPELLMLAPAYDESLITGPDSSESAAYLKEHAMVLGAGPQWGDTSNPAMATLVQQAKKYRPEQGGNQYFMFGYAQAWAMDQLLEIAAKNGDFSKQGLLSAMNQIGTLKFNNLLPDYKYGSNVKDRVPPPVATIFSIDSSVSGGLKAIDDNFTSKAAQSYKFTPSSGG